MLEQELKIIWQDSAPVEQLKFDSSKLIIEFKHKMKRLERDIRARDRRESIAAGLGVILHLYLAYEIPYPLSKLACVLVAVWMIYVIVKLRAVRQQMPQEDLSLSFRDQLTQQKHYMVQQKSLLDNVLYWYVLPPFILNLIFVFGLGHPADYNWSSVLSELLPDSPDMAKKLRLTLILAVFYGFVVWLNKSAAKNKYEPMIKDLERVQQQLDN